MTKIVIEAPFQEANASNLLLELLRVTAGAKAPIHHAVAFAILIALGLHGDSR